MRYFRVFRKFNTSFFYNEKWLPKQDIIIGLIISSFMINILSLSLPLCLLQVYDRIIPNSSTETLKLMLAGVITAIMLELILKICRSVVVSWGNSRSVYRSHSDCFNTLLNTKTNIWQQKGEGELIESFATIETIKSFFGVQTISGILDLPFVVIFVAIIAYIQPFIAVASLAVICATLIYTRYSSINLNKGIKDFTATKSSRANFVFESINGINNIKQLGLEEQFNRKYEDINNQLIDAEYNNKLLNGGTNKVTTFIGQLHMIVIVSIGSIFTIFDMLTIGGLAACTLLSSKVIQPVIRCVNLWLKFQEYRLLFTQQKSLKTLEQEPSSISTSFNITDLKISNLSFRYNKTSSWIINNANFEIPSNSCTLIIGESPIKKMILTSLLSGIAYPTKGKISIGDFNITNNLARYRELVAYLPQNGTLLSGTILENITCFNESNNIKQARSLCAELGVNHDVEQLSQGFHTKVGNSLTEIISKGLVQKISIVRALNKSTKVIIFDQACNNLDVKACKQLNKYLSNLKGNNIIILNTENPNFINLADYKLCSDTYTLKCIENVGEVA